jgi:hypothetical protein
MKKIHSILIATTMLLFVASCSNEKTIGEREKNLKLFKISRENKDVYTAIAALNLYLLDDTVVGPYHDTLATMYFVTGNFASGVLIGEKV